MRQILLDLFSGVAGDMLVGGLLDAGAPREVLERTLASLPEEDFRWELRREKRHGIAGWGFRVSVREGGVHRRLAEVEAVLDAAELSPRARGWAGEAFRALAEAEGICHDLDSAAVHFHEVGATDAIVDVAAACALMDALDPQGIHATPVAVGSGFADCAHGRMPVPAPGTLRLLIGMPVRGADLEGERATPTGVALLRAWGTVFGGRPAGVARAVGYGAGRRDPADAPNLLRVVVEEAVGEGEDLLELRSFVDDQGGEVVGAALETLHAAGAVEAYATAAVAKKGRPAFEVCVLCSAARRGEFEDLLFRHLGTLGMRVSPVVRTRRPRRVETRQTPLGPLPFKLREDPAGEVVLKPEFEALKARAAELGLTPREALARLRSD